MSTLDLKSSEDTTPTQKFFIPNLKSTILQEPANTRRERSLKKDRSSFSNYLNPEKF